MTPANVCREKVNEDLALALQHYGDYDVTELRNEIEVVQMLASGTNDETKQESFAQQAYLMRLVLFSWGVRI